ncbi:uncharacterized protein LOC131931950 [Physella acuta]|uniref:uncharacterized protein LOC131931950 n=1 Tax=Physella acuta TaxID=109671 RepID=UPI0027DC2266|nr:uncharacterized protein LOC131931950 [Physella acuta]
MLLARTLLFLALMIMEADAGCSRSRYGFNLAIQGQSQCNSTNDFITGFSRKDKTTDDPLNLLDEVECCTRNSTWTNYTHTLYADWSTMSKTNTWSTCPAGYFMTGFYVSDAKATLLSNILEGRCSRPADHPPSYGQCYDHDISTCFDNKGFCKCNDTYFVTGIYRGSCDKLNCLDKLRCCKAAAAPEELNDLAKVKTRIMDTTMSDIALFANYLGYSYCQGCRAANVGEDFRRTADTWVADKSARCVGLMSDKRLSMVYGNWSFAIKDIKFGTPVSQELTPEAVDSGTIYNNDTTEVTKTISRAETVVRSVTHTTTSSWTNSHELNVQVMYTVGGFGATAGYSFNYETSTSTTDENKKEQSKTFTVSTSKTLKPKSAAKWSLVMSKTRTSVAYTATVIVKFSTELQGFLRLENNFHSQYRGTNNRPTVNYRFGDSSIPFYTALKQQSEANLQPWLWNDMINRYPTVKPVINDLLNENRYVFKITGRFDEVMGKSADFRWDAVKLRKRAAVADERNVIRQNATHIAKALANDVPLVKLEPPKVDV